MLQALIRKVVLCKSDGLIPFIFLLNNCMEKKGNDGRNEGLSVKEILLVGGDLLRKRKCLL